MSKRTAPRPAKASKAIDAYYKTLKDYDYQYALHEGAVSTAFQTLLSETGKTVKPYTWTLIPQLSEKYAGREVRPDGTLKDEMHLVRGHWDGQGHRRRLRVRDRERSSTTTRSRTGGLKNAAGCFFVSSIFSFATFGELG